MIKPDDIGPPGRYNFDFPANEYITLDSLFTIYNSTAHHTRHSALVQHFSGIRKQHCEHVE
ncbi:hypothetical protein CE161_09660 [Bifidobacterium longum]|nr:hypothetical protein CE161_09660 [Bifidobacterium longum]